MILPSSGEKRIKAPAGEIYLGFSWKLQNDVEDYGITERNLFASVFGSQTSGFIF